MSRTHLSQYSCSVMTITSRTRRRGQIMQGQFFLKEDKSSSWSMKTMTKWSEIPRDTIAGMQPPEARNLRGNTLTVLSDLRQTETRPGLAPDPLIGIGAHSSGTPALRKPAK